jgi:hypothetical protein
VISSQDLVSRPDVEVIVISETCAAEPEIKLQSISPVLETPKADLAEDPIRVDRMATRRRWLGGRSYGHCARPVDLGRVWALAHRVPQPPSPSPAIVPLAGILPPALWGVGLWTQADSMTAAAVTATAVRSCPLCQAMFGAQVPDSAYQTHVEMCASMLAEDGFTAFFE